MAKHERPTWLYLALVLVAVLSLASTGLSVWLTLYVNMQQVTIEGQAAEISTLKEQIQNLVSSTASFGQVEKSVNKRHADSGRDSHQTGIGGPAGPPGPPGPPGHAGRDGRDAVNFLTINNHIRNTVSEAVEREMGVAGAVYVRWGRTTCPSQSSLLYTGLAAGTPYSSQGGTTKYICLPKDPVYSGYTGSAWKETMLTAVEYRGTPTHHDHSAPCAVCQATRRFAKLMIPAKLSCPDSSWTLEYNGFLMTDHKTHRRMEHVCVDMHRESRPGAPGRNEGALWYHLHADCAGQGNLFHCPPYDTSKSLNCVVCTK